MQWLSKNAWFIGMMGAIMVVVPIIADSELQHIRLLLQIGLMFWIGEKAGFSSKQR